eukprot:TRINITY_DN66919_c7_g3_i1.p1 TRINITY_DN66919_c7_g3~~TRINITY_DN66919_c7_g3_i1.p1  ORF type:complete len:755 (+),score=456.13 TRINITY_DN66919_c7_g3_i1:153-2267(+)
MEDFGEHLWQGIGQDDYRKKIWGLLADEASVLLAQSEAQRKKERKKRKKEKKKKRKQQKKQKKKAKKAPPPLPKDDDEMEEIGFDVTDEDEVQELSDSDGDYADPFGDDDDDDDDWDDDDDDDDDADANEPQELSEEYVARLENDTNMELASSHVKRAIPEAELKTADLSKVLHLVAQHASRFYSSSYSYLQGTAQLAATILEVTQSYGETLNIMCLWTRRMQPYLANDCEKLRVEVLVLADLLAQEMPELCAHFNENGFDVVDLSDVVVAWAAPLFAWYFPRVAVKRILDVFMFEGPESLIGFVLGVFHVFEPMLQATTEDRLFRFVTDIPTQMTEHQIEDAFQYGYETFRQNASRVHKMREEKDLQRALSRPGAIRFAPGVGGPDGATLAESQSKQDFQDKLAGIYGKNAAELEEKHGPSGGFNRQSSEENLTITMEDADEEEMTSLSTTNVLYQLDKLHKDTNDHELKRLLLDAQGEMRAQARRIRELQREVRAKEQEARSGGSGGGAGSASLSLDMSSMTEGDTSLSEAESPRTPMSHGSDSEHGGDMHLQPVPKRGKKKKRKNADAKLKERGFVRYSKLFVHQTYPALYMEGYLLKARKKSAFQRRVGASLFGNLHRRFFVLIGSFLTYFKSHRNSKPSHDESCDMRGRTISQVDNHQFGQFGFEISAADSNECLYLVFASNADERTVWMSVLQAAADS